MTDEDFMRLAIEEAKRSESLGGIAVGAVLVKDGEVIAREISGVTPDKDPSAHGEILCMRTACRKFGQVDLPGCTVFTTLEPCSMCLACAGWANLSRIVFGAYREDVAGNPYELADYRAEETAKKIVRVASGKNLVVAGGVLREECKQLMTGYKNWWKSGI